MTARTLSNACYKFAETAAPLLHITDESHHQLALELIEELLLKASDNEADPLNAIIGMISHSIESYENQQDEFVAFEKAAMNDDDGGVAALRHLMDQYDLGVSDLPEIGSKSMVSMVLANKRALNKEHIKALSKRFNVSPALFF
jgi:HTH-type transcriptional regulator/antitoxin HigA